MAHPAKQPSRFDTDAAVPRATLATMSHLMDYARQCDSLPDLTQAFATMIGDAGFFEHLCVAVSEDGSLAPLFGNIHLRPAALMAQDHTVLLPVQFWGGEELLLCLFGRTKVVDRDEHAKLHGWAEVYATFALALLERERDIPTSAGFGLAQRQCLAHLLTGHSDQEIAERLELTPLAVRGHVEAAMRLLEVDTRAEAVAIAARRGWLAGLGPGFFGDFRLRQNIDG